ncbi:MAG: 7TM-DISM domain-containing protein, partial [Hydrogenophaga sp.]
WCPCPPLPPPKETRLPGWPPWRDGGSHWELELARTGADRADLYYRDPQGQWQHQQGGDRLPVEQWHARDRFPVSYWPAGCARPPGCRLA